MRIVLVQDLVAAVSDPDDAPLVLVPDFPELCPFPIVSTANLLGVLVDAVLGLLYSVARVLEKPLTRLARVR